MEIRRFAKLPRYTGSNGKRFYIIVNCEKDVEWRLDSVYIDDLVVEEKSKKEFECWHLQEDKDSYRTVFIIKIGGGWINYCEDMKDIFGKIENFGYDEFMIKRLLE